MNETLTHTEPIEVLADDAAGPLSQSDLASLMAGFTEVSAKLEATHRTLQAEVRRLNGELRRANEELDRSRRLAALGEMAAGIAHEVRNPLGSIALYARMLRDDVGDNTEALEMLKKIGRAVTGLDAVVNDVLAFSRELRVSTHPVMACDLFERAASACGDLLPAPVLIEGEDEPVWCDPMLAHQALVNVLRNACEAAGREHGRVDVVVRATELAPETPDDEAGPRRAMSVAVIDNGPGVPPEVLARMFNPFFTTRAAGTGLGLAIVHRIMDAHTGTVRVGDAGGGPGSGAMVELVFPTGVDEESNARAMAESMGAQA